MKKNLLKFAVILFVSIIVFSGCKKGEDDPFISFRSRTARLAGNWKLSSMEVTIAEGAGGSSNSNHFSYNGTTMTISENSNGYNSTYSEPFSLNWIINKDGTYNLTSVTNSSVYTESGNWSWLNKNKHIDRSNKEAIILSVINSAGVNGNTNYSGKTNFNGEAMLIKRLANKELVVIYDYAGTDSDGYSHSETGTATYTQD